MLITFRREGIVNSCHQPLEASLFVALHKAMDLTPPVSTIPVLVPKLRTHTKSIKITETLSFHQLHHTFISFISADPGLGQGRGGAWDHRRCGTSPSSLSTVKPILQPSSHINSFCRLPALKPSKLHLAANSHPAPHTNRFFWPLLHPTATPRPHINGFLRASKFAVCQPLQTLTWHASSCSQQPPRATHQWLLVATLAA